MTLIIDKKEYVAGRRFALSGKALLFRTLFALLPAILAVAAYAEIAELDADGYWEWAIGRNTAQAFRCFLHHYPDDPRADEARRHWERLDFEQARKENRQSSYRTFLRRHPDSSLREKIPHSYHRDAEQFQGSFSDTALAQEALSVIINALTEDDIKVTRQVAKNLGRINDGRAVEELVKLLKYNDRRVRSHAAESLGETGDRRAVKPLTAMLKDRSRVISAIQALGRIGDERSVDALVEYGVSKDQHPGRVISRTAKALRQIGDSRAIEKLADIMLSEDGRTGERLRRQSQWRKRRQEAAYILGGIGNPKAVDALKTASSDNDNLVRYRTVIALGRIGDPSAIEALIAALSDDNGQVRYAAADALSEIGDRRAVDSLISVLPSGNSFAARALGRIGEPSAAEALINTLFSSDKRIVRIRSAVALGQLGGAQANKALLTAMNDDDEFTRRGAAEGLGHIGGLRAQEALRKALSDEHQDVRLYAARSLARISDSRTIEPLVATLRNDNYYLVRKSAVESLGSFVDKRAIDALIGALSDAHRTVRMSAVEALGMIGDCRAVGPLIEALGKGNERAAIALGDIGDPESVEGVMAILSELSSINRRFIPDVLASIALKNDPSILKEYLEHDESLVRETAAQALAIVAEKQFELLLGMSDEIAQISGEEREESRPETPETDVLARLRQAGSRMDDGRPEALSEMLEDVKRSNVDEQVRFIGEVAAHGQDMGVDPLKVLSAIRSESGSRIVRLKALGELTRMGDEEAAAEIRKHTTAEDMTERIYAARSPMAGYQPFQ